MLATTLIYPRQRSNKPRRWNNMTISLEKFGTTRILAERKIGPLFHSVKKMLLNSGFYYCSFFHYCFFLLSRFRHIVFFLLLFRRGSMIIRRQNLNHRAILRTCIHAKSNRTLYSGHALLVVLLCII